MDLRLRFSRAQLVALGACAVGLGLFDKMAIGGVVNIRDEATFAAMQAQVPHEFREWLGPIAATGDGDGDGYGDGYGYGSGSGSGYGDGSGSGSGDGYGYGSGSGDG